MKLIGKVAVITGGSSGIGLASAKKFQSEGAYIFIVGRRQPELEIAKRELGINATAIRADVSNIGDLDHVFGTVRAEKGVIDILVASAGVVEQAPIDSMTPEHFDNIFNVNTRGLAITVQKALPLMVRGGSIVLISSIAWLMGFPAHGVYAASKAAVRSFARTWASELKERGIRVNSLSPGGTDTPMVVGQYKTQEQLDSVRTAFTSLVPLSRFARPEEQAAGVMFLASDDSSYITGFDLQVDGGIAQV
jgi:NAD(P)-dependent dehydrogenase (short-subunit alcohol dehydrogenase family)